MDLFQRRKAQNAIKGINSCGLHTEYCFPQGHNLCVIEATDWLDALCVMQPLRLCRVRVGVKNEGKEKVQI